MKSTLKPLLAFALLILLAMTVAAGSPQNFILQLQNAGSAIATFANYGVLNCSTGMTCTASGSTVTLTASGSGVSSVTFTGDGTILSSTPSTAVTTTGTLTAAMAQAAAGSVLSNITAAAATPLYNQTLKLGAVGGTSGMLTLNGSTSGVVNLSAAATAAGVLSVGNSASQNSSTGKVKASGYISVGTTFTTNAGCTEGTLVGGGSAGKFTVGQGTACTVIITMGDTATAPNGWSCWANDQTTVPTVAIRQTASTATTASLLMTVTTSDVIAFGCVGY